MYRDDAYRFFELLVQFEQTGVKVMDIDPERETVELQLESGEKGWYSFNVASKVVEASST